MNYKRLDRFIQLEYKAIVRVFGSRVWYTYSCTYSNFYYLWKDINQISLWDAIIGDVGDAHIILKDQAAEYLAYDMSNKLKYIFLPKL